MYAIIITEADGSQNVVGPFESELGRDTRGQHD